MSQKLATIAESCIGREAEKHETERPTTQREETQDPPLHNVMVRGGAGRFFDIFAIE